MRALILADRLFAVREHAMLSRLEIGLADEGVRVVHAIPRSAGRMEAAVGAGTSAGVFASSLTYSDAAIPFTLGLRAQSLLDQVRRRDGLDEDERAIDVVHACGGSAWGLALEIARREDALAVLEVWRMGLVAKAASLRGHEGVVLLAPDTTIERALRSALGTPASGGSGGGGVAAAAAGGMGVEVGVWGVYAPAEVRTPLTGEVASVMVVGSGHDTASFAAAVAALAEVAKRHPTLLVFLDADAARRVRAWRIANQAGVLSQFSCIEHLEARRDLLVAGDILMLPEARGEQRTSLLEAMASGMIVVAASDPGVSVLQNGFTARLIGEANRSAWESALTDVLSNPAEARRLSASAHAYIAQHRRASAHVRAVLQVYGRSDLRIRPGPGAFQA